MKGLVTKSSIKQEFPDLVDVDSMCGIASIFMMLSGHQDRPDFLQLRKSLIKADAYSPDTGVIMKRVPRALPWFRMYYARYMPYWLMILLLRFGYYFSISKKNQNGNHIVFVYGVRKSPHLYDFPKIAYVDPNVKDTKSSQRDMSYSEWKSCTNHRLLFCKR